MSRRLATISAKRRGDAVIEESETEEECPAKRTKYDKKHLPPTVSSRQLSSNSSVKSGYLKRNSKRNDTLAWKKNALKGQLLRSPNSSADPTSSNLKNSSSIPAPELPDKKDAPVPEPSAFQKLTVEEIKTMELHRLMNILSEQIMPSKTYELKFFPITNEESFNANLNFEDEYYKLYEADYNKMKRIEIDLKVLVDKYNHADEKLLKHSEEKLREYILQCFGDSNYHKKRINLANLTAAVQLLRNHQDAFLKSRHM